MMNIFIIIIMKLMTITMMMTMMLTMMKMMMMITMILTMMKMMMMMKMTMPKTLPHQEVSHQRPGQTDSQLGCGHVIHPPVVFSHLAVAMSSILLSSLLTWLWPCHPSSTSHENWAWTKGSHFLLCCLSTHENWAKN